MPLNVKLTLSGTGASTISCVPSTGSRLAGLRPQLGNTRFAARRVLRVPGAAARLNVYRLAAQPSPVFVTKALFVTFPGFYTNVNSLNKVQPGAATNSVRLFPPLK